MYLRIVQFSDWKKWSYHYLKKKLYSAGVSKIEIERTADRVKVILYTAKPGVVIGKGGSEIDKLKAETQKYTTKKLFMDIKEIKRPDKDAQLVAENIAAQLEKRTSFRRAMKKAIQSTMRAGAKGIKVSCGGRLGGAEIARTEHYHEGTIPLQTLRADIDYGVWEANTTYGKVGVKVWIFKGEVLPDVKKHFTTYQPKEEAPRGDRRDGRRGDRRNGDRRPQNGDRKPGNRFGGNRPQGQQSGAPRFGGNREGGNK